MDVRSLRSGALGVIAIARQFGVRITADAIEGALEQGNIKSPKDLEKTLAGLGVTAQFRRVKSQNFKVHCFLTVTLNCCVLFARDILRN